MYLLVAHATLASCDCPFAQARCHARAAAAASHAGYTQGWIFIFLSIRSLEARRPPSNEGVRKCCVGLSSGGQVRSEPDWRLERMNWDFSCCRSIWEALVWAASLLQGLPCTYVIGPSKLKHFSSFFTLPARALGRTKLVWANLDDSNQVHTFQPPEAAAHTSPYGGVAPFCVYDWIVKNIPVALLIYPQNG